MRIQTFSIVIGGTACDGACPFCVSHTTGFGPLPSVEVINVRNLRKATKFAQIGQCSTCLFTGKGEPTLYPQEIDYYLTQFQIMGNPFPFLELQTNGLRIASGALDDDLRRWLDQGLNTIALSVVDVDRENNKRIYLNHRDMEYPSLAETCHRIRNLGYTIRLCVMMHRGIVDSPAGITRVVEWCKEHRIAQLTIRPLRSASAAREDNEYAQYIRRWGLNDNDIIGARQWVQNHPQATQLLTLMHGANTANVYDVNGQNLCMSDCLTVEPSGDDIRTLIFYADGTLTYDWQYPGARLL